VAVVVQMLLSTEQQNHAHTQAAHASTVQQLRAEKLENASILQQMHQMQERLRKEGDERMAAERRLTQEKAMSSSLYVVRVVCMSLRVG
jgi:hypothetical protein